MTVKNGVSIWEHVHVGENVSLGPNVVLTNDRFPRSRDSNWRPEETWLEEGATVGANATILCGIRLGRRCLVGAGSVVTRDVPPHALVVGMPDSVRGCATARNDSSQSTERQTAPVVAVHMPCAIQG